MTYGLTMPVGRRRRRTCWPKRWHSPQRLLMPNSRSTGEPARHLALTERADMPDIVRAKLHKITGYVLRDAEQLPEALAHLQRAMQLDRTIGVKKDIER
jgi:hypothetical protein